MQIVNLVLVCKDAVRRFEQIRTELVAAKKFRDLEAADEEVDERGYVRVWRCIATEAENIQNSSAEPLFRNSFAQF